MLKNLCFDEVFILDEEHKDACDKTKRSAEEKNENLPEHGDVFSLLSSTEVLDSKDIDDDRNDSDSAHDSTNNEKYFGNL